MKISLSGLLEKAARSCDAHRNGGEGFAIRELLQNLQELRDRKSEVAAVIEEFFAIYVLNDVPTERTAS